MKVTIGGTEETSAVSYSLNRGINGTLDQATITIADVNGSKTQSYLFTSKGFKEVVIEDPTGTTVFAGRILDMDTQGFFLVLTCESWLAQLGDFHLLYDTKEILKSGTTIRQGKIGSVSGYNANDCYDGGGVFSWTDDQWVGKFAVVFPDGLATADRQEWDYCTSVTGGGDWISSDHNKAHVEDWDDYWEDAPPCCVVMQGDSSEGYLQWLSFDVYSAVAKSAIIDLDLDLHWGRWGGDINKYCRLKIYNWDTSSYDTLYSNNTMTFVHNTIITDLNKKYVKSETGCIRLKFGTDEESDTNWLIVDYIRVIIHYSGSVTTTVFPITDNTANDITSSVSFQTEGIAANDPFHIVKMSSEHVKSLAQSYDVQKTINVDNVVDTNKYPPRSWNESTALQIITDLGKDDQADFWLALDQKLYYNKPPTSATRTLDDDDCLVVFGIKTQGREMRNEAHVWGHKYSDSLEIHQVRENASSKSTFGITRSVVERDTSIYTTGMAVDKGDALTNRYAFPERNYRVAFGTKKNRDGYRVEVGELVNLKSTKYGVDVNLMVVGTSYDLDSDITGLTLAKLGSQAKVATADLLQVIQSLAERTHRLTFQSAERT